MIMDTLSSDPPSVGCCRQINIFSLIIAAAAAAALLGPERRFR